MDDRKCPHLTVSYRKNRNYNSYTGAWDCKPDGWFCTWCDQEFGTVTNRCCSRDNGYDGNCDLHSAPGVSRFTFQEETDGTES